MKYALRAELCNFTSAHNSTSPDLCKSTFIIFIFIIFTLSYANSLCQNHFKWSDLHDIIYIFFDNRVYELFQNVGFYGSFLQFHASRNLF